MNRNHVYCCICCGPMLESGHRGGKTGEWLTNAVLLTTAHDKSNGIEPDTYNQQMFLLPDYPFETMVPLDRSRVLKLQALCVDGNQFHIQGSGESVDALEPAITGGPLYLPVNERCQQLTRMFILHSRGEINEDAFWMQFWVILLKRMPYLSLGLLSHHRDYWGGAGCRGQNRWERGEDPSYGYIMEADPLLIQDLTASILQNLEEAPPPSPVQRAQPPLTLSGLLQDPLHGHTQDEWCALFDTSFPWLWDLDRNLIEDVRRGRMDWDWERLVRRLAHVEFAETEEDRFHLPLGLRNRRRIWRVLEEATPGDTAAIWRAVGAGEPFGFGG